MEKALNEYKKELAASRKKHRRLICTAAAAAVLVGALTFWQLRSPGVALTEETLEEEYITVEAEPVPLAEEAPAAEVSPAFEETPAAEATPVPEEAPAAAEETAETAAPAESAETPVETTEPAESAETPAPAETAESTETPADTAEPESTETPAVEETGETEETETEDTESTEAPAGETGEPETGASEEPEETETPVSDPTADLESAAYWESTLPAELPETWGEAILAVAESQLGYTESEKNFVLSDDGDLKGYTRYGAWYGLPYGDWCAMFASFCLHYAGVPETAVPAASGVHAWEVQLRDLGLWRDASEYTPNPGDLVFLDPDGETGEAQHVGVVASLDENNTLHTVEGNTDNAVARREYAADSADVLGYADIAAAYDAYALAMGLVEPEPAEPVEYAYSRSVSTENYDITVSYNDDAAIPEEAELLATEYAPDSDEFLARCEEAGTEFEWVMDIGFYIGGEKIEPAAAVSVVIASRNGLEMGGAVTHFTTEGEIEGLDAEGTDGSLRFITESFSDFGVKKVAATDEEDSSSFLDKIGETVSSWFAGANSGIELTAGPPPQQQECDQSNYNGDLFVYWDTATINTSGSPWSATVNGSKGNVAKVTLSGKEVQWSNGNNVNSASGGSKLSDYYGEATTATTSGYADLVIEPEAGYYVTKVVICCTSGSVSNNETNNPKNCNTLKEKNAFSASFVYSGSGSTTIQNVNSKWFAHGSNKEPNGGSFRTTNAYWILIETARIPTPLYVAYEYGDAGTILGNNLANSVFNNNESTVSAKSWIEEPTDKANVYEYVVGTMTGAGKQSGYGNTLYKYMYDKDKTGDDAESAVNWKHYANNISDEAKQLMASYGYYFDGWEATYYSATMTGQVNTDVKYNNGMYTYTSATEMGTSTYQEDESVSLHANVILRAKWVPYTVTVQKTMKPENTDVNIQTLLGDSGQSYQLTLNGSDNANNKGFTTNLLITKLTSNYTIADIVGSADGTVIPGAYTISETSGTQEIKTSDGTTYYGTPSYSVKVGDGQAQSGNSYTIKTTDIINKTKITFIVTNTYSDKKSAEVKILKVDSTDHKTTLENAVFKLYGSKTENNQTVVDKENLITVNNLDSVKTEADGTVSLGTLYAGTYYLEEITAPAGYNLPANLVAFSVTTDGKVTQSGTIESLKPDENGVYTITVENSSGRELPSTGGAGIGRFIVLGLALMGAAGAGAFIARKRRAVDEN